MPKFRKKPVVIEAMQFRGPDVGDLDYMLAFDDWLVGNAPKGACRYHGSRLVISTLEGEMEASAGDWVIRGIKGEIYPCKPDIFAALYDPAE